MLSDEARLHASLQRFSPVERPAWIREARRLLSIVEAGCWGVTEQKIHLSKGLDGLFPSCGMRRPRFAKDLAKETDLATNFCE